MDNTVFGLLLSDVFRANWAPLPGYDDGIQTQFVQNWTHYFTPYPHPPNWFFLLLLIYITIYSFTHSGSLRVLLTASTSSAQLQSPVDPNALSPVWFPLLLPQLLWGCPKASQQPCLHSFIRLLISLVSAQAPSIPSSTWRSDRSVWNANQIPLLLFQIPQWLSLPVGLRSHSFME